MNDIKGIIFDFGGTLDTHGVHWFHIFRQEYSKRVPHITEEQLREAYVYTERYLAMHRVIEPTDNFLDMLRKKIAIQLSQLAFSSEEIELHTELLATSCNDVVLSKMEQTRRILERLSAHYPMVLVSNFYGNISSVLQTYELSNYFRQIIESAIVGIRKPNPEIFALGINALGLTPNEVLVVGDSYSKDIQPAHTLGCRTAWLKGQGWNNNDEPSDSSCADFIISELSEIADILNTVPSR